MNEIKKEFEQLFGCDCNICDGSYFVDSQKLEPVWNFIEQKLKGLDERIEIKNMLLRSFKTQFEEQKAEYELKINEQNILINALIAADEVGKRIDRNKVIDEVESLLTAYVSNGAIDMYSINVEDFINKLKEVVK